MNSSLRFWRRLSAGAVLGVLCAPGAASAGGLYFTDRGVRPLGRGGAFIAGADDAGAVAYNPAGLAFAGTQLLVDASWLQYSATYQRKALLRQVDPNTGQPTGQEWEQTFPSVDGTTPVLPIPTIAYAFQAGSRALTYGLALWAPYSAITSFPEQVRGGPAPQRYSIISLDGSALAIPGAYVAWHEPGSDFALGAGVEMLTGFFQTSVYFSACVPDRFICAPEQPDYDTYARLRVGPIFAPSGILGAIYAPDELLRLGLSFHLPYWVNASAKQDVRLASAAAFDNASVSGDSATVKFRLPWTLRAGVEVRPTSTLRVEGGVGYEAWSMHDEIRVEPDDIALVNVAGFPERYYISDVSIERGFRDSYSARLGGELGFELGSYRLVTRAGLMAERSAIPPEYLSAATIDLDKIVASIGGSLHIGNWRFDAVMARVFTSAVEVGTREAQVRQVNPVLANPTSQPHTINAGTYTATANVLGLGLVYQFEPPPSDPASPAYTPSAPEPKPRPKPRPKAATERESDDGGFDEAFDAQDP